MRIIKIENSIVTEVKFLSNGYECRENEYVSKIGEIGQRKLADGTFEDVEREVIELQPSIEEEILIETKYQTVLLEMNAMF